MPVPLCRHIKTNGLRCCGAALAESPFCYFHRRLHQRHVPYRFTTVTRGYLLPGQHIELGPLEDPESVQLAISQVVNALATGALEPKRAACLLYGLQLASSNARNLELQPPGAVRSIQSLPEDTTTPGLDLADPDPPLTDEAPGTPSNTSQDHQDHPRPPKTTQDLTPVKARP
jgi:hypothetical protein